VGYYFRVNPGVTLTLEISSNRLNLLSQIDFSLPHGTTSHLIAATESPISISTLANERSIGALSTMDAAALDQQSRDLVSESNPPLFATAIFEPNRATGVLVKSAMTIAELNLKRKTGGVDCLPAQNGMMMGGTLSDP
jgi:hypothetical protein